MLICTETNHCYLTSRNTSIFEKFPNCTRHLSIFFKGFCYSSYFLFGKFVVTRDFLQSYEMADFQTCERQVTVFYQTNVNHSKVILPHIMAQFLYKLGSLRRLSRAKCASLRCKINLQWCNILTSLRGKHQECSQSE